MTETFPMNFKEAMEFMIKSILELGSHNLSDIKPSWLSDTERFRSFFHQITKAGKIDTAKQKICTTFFVNNQENLIKPVSSSDGRLNDSFLKYDTDVSKSAIRSKTTRRGLYLTFGGVFLPISEAYVKSINVVENSEHNLPHRIKILGSLYCLMYHTVKDIKDHVEFELEPGSIFSAYVSENDKKALRNNMEQLLDSLEGYDSIKPKSNIFSNIFGSLGIDEKQISEMAKNLLNQGEIKNMIEPLMQQLSSGNFDMANLSSMAENLAKTHTLNVSEEDFSEESSSITEAEPSGDDPSEQS